MSSKAVLYIAVSLDGFVAGPNDDISWLSRYNDVDYGFEAFFSNVGAMIQGRRAYEVELRNGWRTPRPVPNFVLTRHPQAQEPPRKDVFFTSDDLADVLARAKAAGSGDVWIEGGANVAQQFLRRQLIDEYHLFVAPVVIGTGVKLFDESDVRFELALQGVRRFDKGLAQLSYARD